jgi:hypothetical protein
MTMKRIVASAFLLLFLSMGVVAAAQEPPKPPSDEQGWEKVNGDMMQQGESIPASKLVAGAYGFIFAAVVVFVASVTMRSRRVEEEMDSLRRKLESKGK